MKTVYIVTAETAYEGWDIAEIFECESDAAKFVEQCHAYDATYKECPEKPDTEKGWAEYEKWFKRDQRWRKKHPAGEHNARRDSYNYFPHKVRPPEVDQ